MKRLVLFAILLAAIPLVSGAEVGTVCATTEGTCILSDFVTETACQEAYAGAVFFPENNETAQEYCTEGCCEVSGEYRADETRYSCDAADGTFMAGEECPEQPPTCTQGTTNCVCDREPITQGQVCCDGSVTEGLSCEDGGGDTCTDESCPGLDECSSSEEFGLSIEHAKVVPETTYASLSWSFSGCEDVAQSVAVYWGKNSYTSGFTTPADNTPQQIGPLDPETTYDIKITTTIEQPGEDLVINATTTLTTGHALCMQGKKNYCYNETTPVNCGINNERTGDESCSEPNVCVPVDDSGDVTAQCLTQVDCDACNRGYDNFAEIPTDLDGDPIEVELPEGIDDTGTCVDLVIEQGSERYPFCYLNYDKGAFQQQTSCSQVDNCAAYTTPDICEDNTCNIESGCEWEPESGVCKSTQQDQIECSLDGLSQEDCEAIADVCGWAGDSCYNKETQLTCSSYEDKQECLGPQEKNFDLNHSDNRPITLSNDTHNLGKCKWTGTVCVKDADDADGPESDSQTATDFANPTTRIISPTDKALAPEPRLQYIATDADNDIYDTYLHYEKGACSEVETNAAAANDNQVNTEDGTFDLIDAKEAGVYCLQYYSKDIAYNLEYVNTKTISITDKQLGFTSGPETQLQAHFDNKTVDATVSFSLNHQARCTVSNDEDERTGVATSFERTFSGLEEAQHVITIRCDSDVGSLEHDVTLPIDFNGAMTRPQPELKTVGYRSQNISSIGIYAINAEQCEYQDQDWEELEETETQRNLTNDVTDEEGTYTYWAAEPDLSSGYYEYQVRCDFNDGTSAIGGPADTIRFAIDDSAPLTTVTYPKNGTNITTRRDTINAPFTGLEATISCQDPVIDGPENKTYQSGVDEMRNGDEGFSQGKRTLMPGDSYKLKCIDNNGNAEPVYNLKIADINGTIPGNNSGNNSGNNTPGNNSNPNPNEKCPQSVCSNGKLDPQCQETDIDCGGVCGATCEPNQSCNAFSDCASNSCNQGTCAEPTCEDEELNGQETGRDCGGPDCEACPVEASCNEDSDCQSGLCLSGSCRDAEDPGVDEPRQIDDSSDEGASLTGILLMVMGALSVLGGGGYIYYEKEFDTPTQSTARSTPTDMRGDVLEHAKEPHEDFGSSALREEAREKRVNERRQDRKELLGAFDKKPSSKNTQEAPEEEDDVFDELDDVAK